jgi:hypothetical protein
MTLLGIVLLTFAPIPTLEAPPAASSPSDLTARPKPTTPEQRVLDAYPPFVRPLLKYGLGGAVALWFLVGIGWLCRQKWRLAVSPEAQRVARRWIAGMLVGVALALIVVGIAFVLWLRDQHLVLLFVAGPLAVLLPPLLASWWSRPGSSPG